MPAQNTSSALVPSGADSNFHKIGFRGDGCANAASALWGRGNERGCAHGFILRSRESPENGSQGIFGQVGNFQRATGRSISVRRASPCCSRRLPTFRMPLLGQVCLAVASGGAPLHQRAAVGDQEAWRQADPGPRPRPGQRPPPEKPMERHRHGLLGGFALGFHLLDGLPGFARSGVPHTSRASIVSAASPSESRKGCFSVFPARLPKTEVHICRLRDDLDQGKGKHRGGMVRGLAPSVAVPSPTPQRRGPPPARTPAGTGPEESRPHRSRPAR